jgi:hypothetical protein
VGWLGYGAVGVCLVFTAFIIYLGVGDPFGVRGGSEGNFPNALSWVAPEPRSASYEWATADELMRSGKQAERAEQGKDVRIVDARTESTGNLVVSVNPIDAYTWAAVAQSNNGRCYAILVYSDPENPRYGGTHKAELPRSTPCKAEHASPQTVRSTELPY